MSKLKITSETDNQAAVEAAAKMGPPGERGVETGVDIPIPVDGTASVESTQVITGPITRPAPPEDDPVAPDPEAKAPPDPDPDPQPADDKAAAEAELDAPLEPEVEAPKAAAKPKGQGKRRLETLRTKIADLTTERKREEVLIQQLRDERQRIATTPPPAEGQPPTPPVEAKVEEKAKPKSEDFEDFEDFTDALTDWKLERALTKQKAESRAERQVEDGQRQLQAQMAQHEERLVVARQTHEDFDSRVNAAGSLRVSPPMEQVILQSQVGPELMLYLAENPDGLQRIMSLDAGSQLRAMGRLEYHLEMQRSAATQTPGSEATAGQTVETQREAPPISKAPPPPTTVRQAPAETSVPMDEMNFQDYRKAREAQLAAAGRR